MSVVSTNPPCAEISVVAGFAVATVHEAHLYGMRQTRARKGLAYKPYGA